MLPRMQIFLLRALLRSQEIENADESLLEDETHSDLVTLKYHCKHFFRVQKTQ